MCLPSAAQRATIAGATSGDTGGAAIEAFAGRDRTDIFILFPDGRVSPVQQRQMTTSTDTNVHALAIEGNFDDCQALVKAMFNDHAFRDRVSLSGVNSINWARIMAQIVYYFSSAMSLGSPDRPVSFTVPTGNFGDIFAGYAAKRMGLPIEQAGHRHQRQRHPGPHLRERRYEMRGRRWPPPRRRWTSRCRRTSSGCCSRRAAATPATVRRYMDGLKQSGSFAIEAAPMASDARRFRAGRADMSEVDETIRRQLAATGYLLDPHTATASMSRDALAHPTSRWWCWPRRIRPSFRRRSKQASGIDPALPTWLAGLMARKERFTVLPSEIKMVEDYIGRHSRAVR